MTPTAPFLAAPIFAAPIFAAMAEGPADGLAVWATTADSRKIRLGVWGLQAGQGTVFLFPGRTEYIEKYGRTATDLLQRGFATLCIDWRGQGLAERALADPLPGHVNDFAEYQQDFAAMLGFAKARGLPQPWFLLAHSMGGCIGLRSLMTDHPFRAAAFSAPMWGIQMPAWQRPLAGSAAAFAAQIGLAQRYAPGTGPETYVTTAGFADNTLTRDRGMWDYMGDHLRAEPQLALGGPTLAWLAAALTECRALARMPSPDLPCLVALGSHERIIDPAPIHARMAHWPGGRLEIYQDGEHEILMDRDRIAFLDQACALFRSQA